MTTYTAAQVAVIAAQAGFTGKGLTAAVSVALAESGGNSQAVHVNSDRYRSRDRGLWQINSHWHPEVSDGAAFNPASCAKAAYSISKGGTSWSAWSTWNNGAAQAQMGRALIAIHQGQAGGHIANVDDPRGTTPKDAEKEKDNALKSRDADPGSSGLSGLDSLIPGASSLDTAVRVLAKTGAWVSDSHNWVRVAWVLGGGIGAVIALDMIGKSGAAGSGVASGIAKVTDTAKTAGKIAMIA